MIKDSAALRELQDSWRGVEALRDKLQRALLGSFAETASGAIFAVDAAHNLPFVHACAVLNDALEQLRDEGHFPCKSRCLGMLVPASKDWLHWNNFTEIEKMVKRRNDVAHRGEILPRTECWEYVDAIKAELTSWGIV